MEKNILTNRNQNHYETLQTGIFHSENEYLNH